jgi:hypothetical protein
VASLLTFCLTLAAGLVLLALFRSGQAREAERRARDPGLSGGRGTEIAETLAIEKANDVAFPVFPAGTLLPHVYVDTFGTVEQGTVQGGQKALHLRLLTGASRKASECRELYNVNIPLKPSDLPVNPRVRVFLRVDESGALGLHAQERGVTRPVFTEALRVRVKASSRRRPATWPLLPIRRLRFLAPFAYGGYVLWSDIDESGLLGWMGSLSMRWFHASYDVPNVLLALALYVPVARCLSAALAFTMPGLAAALAYDSAVNVRRSSPPVPARAPGGSFVQERPSSPMRVGASVIFFFVWLVVTFGALAGAIAFVSWNIAEQRRAAAPLLSLDAFSGTVPASPRVTLEGWLRPRLAARYQSFSRYPGRRGFSYRREGAFTPVTSANWKPGDSVSVLLETSTEKPDDGFGFGRAIHWKPGGDPSVGAGGRTDDRAAPDKTRLNVRLRANDLPYFVKEAYLRSGMRLTDPYWVADTDSDARPFALALLGAVLLSVLLGTAGVMQRKRLRPPSAPS